MKKSKHIELILITAVLASCNRPTPTHQQVYLRSDTTAPYTRAHYHGGPYLWFYAFRPYGNYRNGVYEKAGYYSGGIHSSSNIGSNGFKSAVSRGGFGRGAFSVSS
jgi:hypothetical protein